MKSKSRQEENLAALKRRLVIRRVKATLFSVLSLALFISAAWYMREGELFRFRGLEISGSKKVSEEEIKEYFFERKNGFFMAKALKDDNAILWFLIGGKGLSARYPRIAEAEITRNFLDRTVKVSVNEKIEKFIWCSDSSGEKLCYWLDESGEAFAKAPDAEGGLVRVISDRAARPIEIGSRPLGEAEIVNLKKIISLAEKWSWPIASIYLKSAELNDVFFVLKTGQEIYFSLDTDPLPGDAIITSLNGSNEWAGIEYLDLRIAGKGFYKLKSSF